MTASKTIARLDWNHIAHQLDEEGYVLLPGLLDPNTAHQLAIDASESAPQVQVSLLEGHESSQRSKLPYPLPEVLADLRKVLYLHLAPVANRWQETLGTDLRYPSQFDEFGAANRAADQTRSASTLNLLCKDHYQALHQHADDKLVFPFQLVALLSQPGLDFSGGEFVMTEQRPRMQSRPIVLPLGFCDAALISVSHRPVEGRKGHYRVNLKHAISRVRSGKRIGLELLFHDEH